MSQPGCSETCWTQPTAGLASPASPPRAWHPISPDIPKDGTPFLSWNAHQNVAAVTWYSRVHEYFIATGGQHLYKFTHWQPITLPTPPAQEEAL